MDIMNVLRTGMNISISHIHIWLCYTMNMVIFAQALVIKMQLYFFSGNQLWWVQSGLSV